MVENPAAPAKPEPKAGGNGEGSSDVNPLKGAEIADKWAKGLTFSVLIAAAAYCIYFAGIQEWSHELPFQADVNFALFAAFIVIAGAIERLLEPVLVVLPPYERKSATDSSDAKKAEIKEGNERARADRALLAYCIALVVGIIISSVFGFYFLETMGVSIGVAKGSGATAEWVFASNGERALRGLDVFITALIITGGTKPLHDMIASIEKKKEALGKAAGAG
jgi:hypothetical protein